MGDSYKFLQVGCGDCSVLSIGSKIIMVDCYESNDYGVNIIDYVPANSTIDLLILTHPHYDHFLGIEKLIANNITVKEIWGSPYERRYGDHSLEYDEYKKYQSLVEKLNAKVYTPTRKEGIYDTIEGYDFYILNPVSNINSIDTRELHDACLVVSIQKQSSTKDKTIFCGDVSDWALDKVIEKYDVGGTNILHASHHGSINGANLDFIKAVSPNYTIISTKSGVHENVPHSTAIQRYKSYTTKSVKRTDTDGTQSFS